MAITNEQAQEWRELADAATPGAWEVAYNAILSNGFSFLFGDPFSDNTQNDLSFIAASRAAVPALLAERDALAAEVAQLRAQLATGKPQPTQTENDAAAARLKRIDELYERYGLGGCFGVSDWPEYAQHEYERLDKAQREYEAKYC